MLNPYYFPDRTLQGGFKINVVSHNLHHTNSKITITPNHREFGINIRYIIKIMKNLYVIYARLKININSNIKRYFQQDLISKMKTIKY